MIRTVSRGKRALKYRLICSARRDVLIKALPGGETRVYAPTGARLRDVDALVAQRMDEILAMHARLEAELAQNRLAHPLRSGSRICIEGRSCALRLISGARVSLELSDGECALTLPHAEDEDAVRAAPGRALRPRRRARSAQPLGQLLAEGKPEFQLEADYGA